MSETLYVLAASYDDIEDALADYEAVKVAYRHVATSHDFDATVVAKDATGKVQIVRRHDEPTKHGTAVGLTWGLATGAVVALFPAVGIIGALAVGGGAGAALGAVAGHAHSAMNRDDMKALGEVIDQGHAGLIVVYAPEMADQVGANSSRAARSVTKTTSVHAEQLAAEVADAEAASRTPVGGRA
jgi:uncharacterized membrane protein